MYRILFVCLGNICRSSAAEEVMRQKLESRGMDENVEVDSAGLIDYHEGELPDSRMVFHARKRGYKLTHRSRPVRASDFQTFDLIIGMDESNVRRLINMASGGGEASKVHKMTEYSCKMYMNNVPDPYYGGDSGFELVLDLLEDACEGLCDEIRDIIATE